MINAEPEVIASSSKHPTNNNPRGINQYKHCPPPDDSRVPELLRGYHRKGITDRKRISKLLFDEHGITISDSTIARRRRDLGLRASGRTTVELPDTEKRQLILDQMVKDSEGKIGAATVKSRILQETGVHITRDWIRKEMQRLAPQAFEARTPHKKASSSNAFSGKTTTRSSPLSNSNFTSAVLEQSTGAPSQSSIAHMPISERGTKVMDLDNDVVHHPSNFYDPSEDENDSLRLYPAQHFLAQSTNPHSHQLGPNQRPAQICLPGPPAPLSPASELQVMLTESMPRMVGLTQFLRTFAPAQGSLDAATSATVLQYMEAAALLERELARVASASGS